MIEELLKNNLYELLLKSKSEKKFFFETPNKEITVLALGNTLPVAFNEMDKFLDQNSDLLLWSGMEFESLEKSTAYSSYITFINYNKNTQVFINNKITDDIALIFPEYFKKSEELPIVSTITQTPSLEAWEDMISKALKMFENHELKKVVLKRKKILTYLNALSPLTFFQNLYSKQNENYQIFLQKNATEAFISFSPEKLFSLTENKNIETLSLAGSAPNGMTLFEDKKNEEELLNSSKLKLEQKIVTDEIENRLSTIADEVHTAPLEIKKLQYIQHRSNKITAQLKQNFNFTDLLKTLHPTPAVGGSPNLYAQKVIRELEQDERSNYAAPIGFAMKNISEWAVGLRSASFLHNSLTIYAGCGIVPHSNPKAEWDETENKMSPFNKLFLGDSTHV
jgi:menaquinone-specific isochorismate synthase